MDIQQTHAMQYKTSDVERQRKIQEYTNVSDPEDLRAELGAARLLAHEALEQGNIGLSNLLLNTIGKLAQNQVAVKRMRSEYLERATVLRLAMELVQIVSRAVENKFPDWECILDHAADEVIAAVAAATNDKQRLEDNR